jgi:hypothetical protein
LTRQGGSQSARHKQERASAGFQQLIRAASEEEGIARPGGDAECRFTLEPETGPIRVRSGTEIETDASLSLNLSANFVALSGESGLLFDCGLPGFDDGV